MSEKECSKCGATFVGDATECEECGAVFAAPFAVRGTLETPHLVRVLGPIPATRLQASIVALLLALGLIGIGFVYRQVVFIRGQVYSLRLALEGAQQWEYRVVTVAASGLQPELERLGADGWELVATSRRPSDSRDGSGDVDLTLKRRAGRPGQQR